ncbi:IclR family transcriptional regulator [Mesorhizobium australicum]|uniref:Transcriptional regulator, IclR family n=1 Tax=Mesorhizobium australicum TaxID=536018 RepID=A0A1X7NGC6_9HYPH|nr:IclR family transcriptional regulator [Mesorhizobium australicum]SMH36167.1 transcriptional regulator, IclR family [Mesorhizobium australicum]
MTVRQVQNVLDLLEFFAERGKPASLAEVSQHFGWPRSSTFNVLSTLSGRGFLFEPEGRGRFYPTPRWLSLSQAISASEPVPEPLLRLARDLAARTDETICVGAASGMSVVFLEVIQSSQRVRYAAEVGQRIPIHATASGQAIMSQWGEAQRNAVLRKVVFERYGSGTPMSIEAVEDQMRAGLHRGWFRSASNYSVDLGGISVPIAASGRVYAVTVAGPLNRIENAMFRIAGEVHEAIARHFGPSYLKTEIGNLTTPPLDRI